MNPAGDQQHRPPGATAPAAAAMPPMSHVAVRLPPFWHRGPHVWFQQVEAQFLLAGITSQLTKYRHIVSSLPPEIAMDVADLIASPPPQAPYDQLRTAVLQRTMMSERKRLQQLLNAEDLGDRRPSQLLRAMQALLADRSASFDEALLRELFLQRLPPTVQMVLTTAASLPLCDLAGLADKVMEVASPAASISAVGHNHPTSSSGLLQQGTVPPLSPAAFASTSDMAAVRADIQRLSETVAALRYPDSRRRSPRRSSRSRRFRHSPRRQDGRSQSPFDDSNPPPCWYHERFGDAAQRCTRPCGWPGNSPGNR
ncbi:uncharacterized protein LOC135373139 [Ornithodoros turicata]|uniref:uncharacterized protein LOC135373139 n=1 Tax=Ornithodoros turicata TaxID=34597 RepID=UPI003139B3BD